MSLESSMKAVSNVSSNRLHHLNVAKEGDTMDFISGDTIENFTLGCLILATDNVKSLLIAYCLPAFGTSQFKGMMIASWRSDSNIHKHLLDVKTHWKNIKNW